MIKVKDKSSPLALFFNKLKNNENNSCHLVLTGMGEQKYDLGNFEDLDFYDDFYVLYVDLSKIEDGEYKWCINDYEQGLMIIGDLKNYIIAPDDVDNYKQDQITTEYIQYEG